MALNINGTTGISGVDGSASAPAVTGTDSNTGINFASDTVNINTGGVTRVIVDSSGNLRAGTLTDSSGTNPSTATQIAQGRAKAWVNFDGTGTPAISDSLNASSITDNGTGNYTVNFTNAMSDTNYCVVQGSNNFGGNNNSVYLKIDNLTTSSFTVQIVASAAFVDRSLICMAVFGDQ